MVALIVIGVTLFALYNFQDVSVTIPFVGMFHTKVFVVIVFSFVAGFLAAGFLSLILKIFSIPSNIKSKRKEGEIGSVSQTITNSKEEKSGKGTV
ncbi:lipopolysaccharide assembly protein LapA domain-containing protein [Desulfurobacterium thermolithotrophum]|uniref:lipopolysaccharide assembly protein LapA domain-containing protein n=1 Tax=Desulfurobacterium thermolithotrophum TaxID=64160 RepID=UPI0013D1B76C